MAIRAAEERKESGEEPFQYAIVLTKTDKVTQKVLSETVKDVQQHTSAVLDGIQNDPNSVNNRENSLEVAGKTKRSKLGQVDSKQSIEIIPSSSLSKEGADQVWKMLQNVIQKI